MLRTGSRAPILTMLTALTIVGCGSGAGTTSPAAVPPTSQETAAPTAMSTPVATAPSVTLDGDFEVAADGRTLHLTCLGVGSPTVLLEAGHPSGGIRQFLVESAAFVSALAAERQVCAYNRAGYDTSDPAPVEPRDLDDITDDLHALLAAADIDRPLVLAGSSFGGYIAPYYAHRFPEDVVGVVLIDAGVPNADLTLAEAPELAWDDPSNPEHIDVIPEVEHRLANERLPFKAPLLVITARDGEFSPEQMAFWLDWSPSSRQIEIAGDHDVQRDSPDEVADAILSVAP